MRLKNKVALITGSSSGIGRAIAQGFGREGASVVVHGRNVERIEKVTAEVRALGSRAIGIQADISKEQDVNLMVEQTVAKFGRIDILVNNAGFVEASPKPFQKTNLAEWKPEIDTTVIGTLLCTSAVMPHMIKQKSGRIINVSSGAGKMGIPNAAVYSACKAAVAGFSRAIAQELAEQGITVNCVSPGPIKTPAMAKAIAENPGFEKAMVSLVPMRKLGEPEDIANIIIFLACDDAKYITGQDYSVDGGQRM